MNFYLTIFFLSLGCCFGALFAQNGIPLPPAKSITYPKTIQYSNSVYKDNIKTILFVINDHNLLRELADPFIPLQGNLKLRLSFDELGNEINQFSYTLIHCTHDWKASDLDPFDYINGFNRLDVTDYNYSFALTQQYVHYQLEIPNNYMQFTKSGNYLLLVYANDNPNDLVLTRRLVVYENKVNTQVYIRPSLATRFFKSHQRLEFSTFYDGLDLLYPSEQLNVSVLQNGRWDNAVIGLKPSFIKMDEMVYSPDMQTTFAAGNEFRFADLRTLRSRGANVAKIENDEQTYHVYLKTDLVQQSDGRRFHVNNMDLNGKYFIGIDNTTYFNRLDADYVLTHFSLDMPKLGGKKIFVQGAFSDWELNPIYEMRFNEQSGYYENAIWLKQGLYDYQYVVTDENNTNLPNKQADASLTEGSFTATENVYYVLTYVKTMDIFNYDRVIGFKCINTGLGSFFDINYRCD